MNKVELMGRLTKDIELKYTAGEAPIAVVKFTIAINRPKQKDKEQEADFINCLCFGKRAEAISKYFRKGSLIALVGNWRTGNYKKDDGTTVYTNECLVEDFYFTSTKNDSNSNSEEPNNNDAFNPDDYNDDDLPF